MIAGASFILGIGMGFIVGRAYARRQVSKRLASLHELHKQLSGPLDFVFCDRSNCWLAVR